MVLNGSRDLEVNAVKRSDIRTLVADSVLSVKKQFKGLPAEIVKYNKKVAKQIQKKFNQEVDKYKRKRKITPALYIKLLQTLKNLRLEGIGLLTDKWYINLRAIRSEMAFVCAMYEFSELEAISSQKENFNIKDLELLKPIVLRLKQPKTPGTSASYHLKMEFVASLDGLITHADKISKKRTFVKYIQKKSLEAEERFDEIIREKKFDTRSDEGLKAIRAYIRRLYLVWLVDIAKTWFPKLKKVGLSKFEIKELRKFTLLKDESFDDYTDQKISKSVKSQIFKIKIPQKPKTDFTEFRSFDLAAAFLAMMKPFEEYALMTADFIDKLIVPKKKLALKTKIKKYKESIVVREFLTVICQTVAPRQNFTNSDVYLEN